MKPLDPVRPDEVSAVIMENELLRYEVIHLRARLEAAEATGKPAKPGKRGKPVPSGTSGKAATQQQAARRNQAQERERTELEARNAAAYDDIVWLIGRLDGSAAGPILRRWAGFRALRSRYGSGRPS